MHIFVGFILKLLLLVAPELWISKTELFSVFSSKKKEEA